MSARIGGMRNKLRELSGMLIRSRVKSKQGRFVCYFRQGLLHCCETLELTVADEAKLHSGALYDIYLLYMYISYITIYRIYSRHRVSIT